MPPKGYRKQSPTDTASIIQAAVLLVQVLRWRDPQSIDLAMAERGLTTARLAYDASNQAAAQKEPA